MRCVLPINSSSLNCEMLQNFSLTYVIMPALFVMATMDDSSSALLMLRKSSIADVVNDVEI